MQTVYYGIEEPSTTSLERSQSYSKDFEVAYVGRLVPEKGLPVLLHAAKHLKDRGVSLKLNFIGDGTERPALEDLANSLGIGSLVHFTGDLRGSVLDHAVSNVALVAMPSIWEETAGLSAIEQMMRGRVVVVADIGGLSEVVGDAGLKFPAGDSDALADCIQRAINDPSVMISLGSAARDRAAQLFNIDGTVRNHLSVYREVAAVNKAWTQIQEKKTYVDTTICFDTFQLGAVECPNRPERSAFIAQLVCHRGALDFESRLI